MKHISEIIEDILVEWAYRVHDGMPNPKNTLHIVELRESMEELNLPNNVIYQVIQNLINEQDDEYEKDKKKMIKWKDEKGKDRETSLATIKTYKYADDYLQNKDKQLAVKAAGLDKKDDKDTPEKEKKKKEPKKVTFKKASDFLTGKDDKPTDTKPTEQTVEKNKSDRQSRFKRGWKAGAPGAPGSMLNEEGSNDVAEHIKDNPDISEKDAVDYLLKKIEGTELEKQNESSTIAGDLRVDDLPPNTPKNKRGIVSKAVLAVRNAKRKAKKANKHSKKHGWKNTSLMNFGGEQSDKDKQKEYLKGKKVVAFKNGKKVVIPPDKVNKLIDTAGGGKNPSDTSSILADKDSNEVTLLFHSDKDSKTAQTGNSTPREELTGKSTQRVLNTLKEDGTLTEEQAEEVLVKRGAYADRIDKVEDEFKTRATNISKKGIEALDNGDIDAQDLIDNFKKTSGAKGNPEKYWNERAVKKYGSDALNDTNKKGKPTSKAKKAKKWLEAGNPKGYDNPPTEEQILRAYLKRNSEEVPTGDDKAILGRLNKGEDTPKRKKEGTVVKGFNFTPDSAKEIEEIRTRALEMELQQKEELNETKINVDGQEVGMGDYLASENVWDFAHMDMMTQTEGTVHEYDDMFEVNMSGHYLNKEVLVKALGVDKKTDFQKRFYVGDLVGQEDKEGNLTGAGKIIYFMKGETKSDDDIAFQEKKIRTKQGPESKASTVYSNGEDLKDLIDKYGKSE
jgi:hypothetical protein